uniref:Uncharacterized protein n=1 Tax=Arundo donax TaxID=35708 RepID=A0A0A9AB95_ARUDO
MKIFTDLTIKESHCKLAIKKLQLKLFPIAILLIT